MTDRTLSAREVEQRREAKLKSGAFSEAVIVPLSKVLYRRLRRRMNEAGGKTHPVTRLRLELLARVLARIQLADEWLARQPHQLFRDTTTGEVHALIDRYVSWVSVAARMVDRLPESSSRALEEDLPAIAAKVRRG
jgi:hypothetical protein